CRSTRYLEAPIARRTAISRSRAVPRARSRFARFAQAINRTMAEMPSSNDNGSPYAARSWDVPVIARAAVSENARYFGTLTAGYAAGSVALNRPGEIVRRCAAA